MLRKSKLLPSRARFLSESRFAFTLLGMKDADNNPQTVPAPIDPMAYYFQDVLLLNKRDAVRLYLIRHGQSASNQAREEGRLGEFDPPLTTIGEEQAERVGARMAAYGVDAVYASPLQRALNTAAPIARRTGHTVRIIEDLQEINEPTKAGSIDPNFNRETADHRAIKARFELEPTWDNLPGGEASAHFRTRIDGAIRQIVEECPGKKVAIACHGGVIQTYVAMVLGLDKNDFPFYAFNASITSVRAWQDKRALWRLNDLAHLEGVKMT
jgi:probable phosphoglycerate mutase